MPTAKINVIIVDDEYSGRSALRILLIRRDYLFGKIITTPGIEEAKKLIHEHHFDICFLDIQLGKNSGFDLLPFLSQKTQVVFVTAYSEFAIKAIKERAFDYILKPVNPMELSACINRYEHEFLIRKEDRNYIFVREHGAMIPIPLPQIEYMEADGAYCNVHLINGSRYTISKTLKAVTELVGEDFIRIHKSYIVNKTIIKSYKKNLLTTNHNTCLPVSRIGAKELSSHYL